MRNVKEIPPGIGQKSKQPLVYSEPAVDALFAELETNGIVVLPSLLPVEQLRNMQAAFAVRLRRMRWNNFEGYQQTEIYRHLIEDVLLLDQGFVDLGLHPLVKQILGRYLGTNYELTEAKGWKSLPTRRDFHGWHGDAWYDQTSAKEIHREVKLAMYLTDVRNGALHALLSPIIFFIAAECQRPGVDVSTLLSYCFREHSVNCDAETLDAVWMLVQA